jgi:hypothetical protein
MAYLCEAGAKPRPRHLTRDSSVRQIGITSTSGTEQMTTPGSLVIATLVIGTRHGEPKNP